MRSPFPLDPILALVRHLEVVRGRKRLQKLAYFLQEAERVPLGLDFAMHHYGPYSRSLDTRLKSLRLAGLLQASEIREGVVEFRLSDEADRQGKPAESLPEESLTQLATLGRLQPNEIELLATIHYLWTDAPSTDTPAIHGLVRAWKGEKYSVSQVNEGVEKLESMGYLSPRKGT